MVYLVTLSAEGADNEWCGDNLFCKILYVTTTVLLSTIKEKIIQILFNQCIDESKF